jgi:hypothetical protein
MNAAKITAKQFETENILNYPPAQIGVFPVDRSGQYRNVILQPDCAVH